MTVDLDAIAAAVDSAVSARTRADWERLAPHHLPRLVRRRVFRPCGRVYGYLVGTAEVPRQAVRGGACTAPTTDARTATDGLRSVFRDLGAGLDVEAVFVRVSHEFLAGDLPLPSRPDRVVVELDGGAGCDALVRDGLLRLKSLGCRVSLGGFTGRADQRRLLPLADFVRIDARDLDVEGEPLLALAASRGARLVGDCVDSPELLQQCRAAGLALVQGRALEEHPAGPVSARLGVRA